MLCACCLWLAEVCFWALPALMLQLLRDCLFIKHPGLITEPPPIPSLISHCFEGFVGPFSECQVQPCPLGLVWGLGMRLSTLVALYVFEMLLCINTHSPARVSVHGSRSFSRGWSSLSLISATVRARRLGRVLLFDTAGASQEAAVCNPALECIRRSCKLNT